MGPFESELRRFHALDWRSCVSSLDTALAANSARPAGLEMSPPSILTGDPFSLEPENCLLVVSINPGWPGAERQRIDCEPAKQAWEAGFDAYRNHRGTYFDEKPGNLGRTRNADPRYNSGHLSRLGNTIARAIGVAEDNWAAGPNARRFFREHAAILDLIPYWSRTTSNLNLASAVQQDCVRQWHAVISAFVREKRPRLIVVNNCRHSTVIDAMLECKIAPVGSTGFFAAHTGAKNLRTPVLAHPFLSRWKITREAYVERFADALRFVGARLPVLRD